MPKYWAATIKDKLRLHGLQLGMKIKYIPKMNKYLVVEKWGKRFALTFLYYLFFDIIDKSITFAQEIYAKLFSLGKMRNLFALA